MYIIICRRFIEREFYLLWIIVYANDECEKAKTYDKILANKEYRKTQDVCATILLRFSRDPLNWMVVSISSSYRYYCYEFTHATFSGELPWEDWNQLMQKT